MRKFEEVQASFKKVETETKLPKRATSKSAGYDFFSKVKEVVKPGDIVKIWSDVKVAMNDDEVLMLHVRSSMGGKWMLTNTTGIIDADYYSNKKNDGNIGIFLKNISDDYQTINVGDAIAQGIFVRYFITDDDNTTDVRVGGFGSTGN